MTTDIDQEVEAIRTVLSTLEPLSPDVRARVVRYVTERLQLPQQATFGKDEQKLSATQTSHVDSTSRATAPIHIKEFMEQKKPQYAVEMAALVAYYLDNLAKPNERKDRITTQDITTYFKIAGFALPKKPQFTLPNAKAAGYFDAIGNGEYKLNAVGHNLVAHSLPRGKDGKTTRSTRYVKKSKPSASKRK